METYFSFVMIAGVCAIIVALFIWAMIAYDSESISSTKAFIIHFITTIAIVGGNGYLNYARSQAIQKKIIKECYYKGVSVKVNKTFKTTSESKLIESKADSVFYIK